MTQETCRNILPQHTDRNLPYFAQKFGFGSAEAVDENGKNIFHHLFTSIIYCDLSHEIAMQLVHGPQLPGNYRYAIAEQKVTGEHPHGWTALHCLCHNSQKHGDVIMELLKYGVVTVTDFDSLTNDNVNVFLGATYVRTYVRTFVRT